MNQAVIYVRISKDRVGAGLGVERQEKDSRALAERLGLAVARVYVDNDISAFDLRKPRPDYQELLGGIRDGSITRVLTWHTDRIHRTPRELEDYIDASELHGCTTYAVQAGELDLTTPGGQAQARNLCTWAYYESAIKRKRSQAQALQAAEKGKSHGGRRPFGWKTDRIQLDPVEHAVIVDLAQRLIAGESLRSLTAELNGRSLPTASWHPPKAWIEWNRSMVRQMLLSPRMAGWRQHKGEILSRGVWEPALDERTWQTIRTLLSDPNRRTTMSAARKSLGIGWVRCGECDEVMKSKHNGRRLYHCQPCGLWRAQEPIDDHIQGWVVEWLLTQLDEEEAPAADPVAEKRIEGLKARIKETELAFAEADDMTVADQLSQLRPMKARLKRLQSELVPPRRRSVLRGATGPDAAVVWFGDEATGRQPMAVDRKRAIAAALVDVRVLRAPGGTMTFDDSTVEITPR